MEEEMCLVEWLPDVGKKRQAHIVLIFDVEQGQHYLTVEEARKLQHDIDRVIDQVIAYERGNQ